jgi:hypothetical protein
LEECAPKLINLPEWVVELVSAHPSSIKRYLRGTSPSLCLRVVIAVSIRCAETEVENAFQVQNPMEEDRMFRRKIFVSFNDEPEAEEYSEFTCA